MRFGISRLLGSELVSASPPPPPPDIFRVAISTAQSEVLADGGAWATQNNLRSEYVAALKEIDFRLKFEAHEWGEGRELLAELGIRMRCGMCKMITVLFGVDEARKVVYVKQFRINKRYHA